MLGLGLIVGERRSKLVWNKYRFLGTIRDKVSINF